MIILDTHSWVNWILQGESGLTKAVLAANNSQLLIAAPAILYFKVSLLVKQRILELPLPIVKWLVEAHSDSSVSSVFSVYNGTCRASDFDLIHSKSKSLPFVRQKFITAKLVAGFILCAFRKQLHTD